MWNPILPALNNLHTSSDFRIGKNGFTYPWSAKLKFQEDRFAKNLEMGRSPSKRAVRWEAYERHRLPLCNVSSSWWKREDAGIHPGAQTMVPTPFPFLRQGKNTWPGRIYALKRHSSTSINQRSWRLIAWSSDRSFSATRLVTSPNRLQLLGSWLLK